MNVSQLINEIVSEWAYRVNDGMPDVKNPIHLTELGNVLSEMGLSSVKTEIINHLYEADENKFTNPVLNKKITYKNTKGEDTEGVVGDLLRQPKGTPARDAAERMLPPEGSPERDEINKDLGGEGQPKKPEDEKGKDGGQAEKEKQQQAQAMFDPKNDPAMAARLDKEKETQAKLAADTSAAKGGPGSGRRPNSKPEDGEESQPTSDEPQATGPEGGPNAEPPTQEPDRPDTTPPTDGETPKEKPKNVDKYGFEKKGSKSLKHANLFGAGGKFYSTQKNGFPEFEEDENGKLIPIDKEAQQDWKTKKLNPLTVSLLKREDRKFYQEISDREDVDGNKLDSEVTDNGSMIIGIEHGENNQSTQNLIDKLNELPPDSKIMFVGEGGMSKDANGTIEFGGEQAEIRDAIKGKFKNSAESSWDENANINDENSPVFDEVAKSVGGSKSKSKAAIWSNMVGQGDAMNANDYLDDEGKKWIIDQAKKAGATNITDKTDFNNLTDAEKKDLYELNYNDEGKMGDNEISKAQEAYNGFRQKELDRKIKEAEEQGYRVIAPVGNSHVDMWRKRNRPEQSEQPSAEKPEEPTDTKTPEQPSAEKPAEKPEEPTDTKTPEQPSAEKPEEPTDSEKPEDKKDDKEDIKKEKPGQEATSSSGKKIYSVGGGYYSDKPNGPAKYVRTEWVVDLAFSDILNEDVFALFEKTISATLSNGKKITVQELPPRAVKKATQKAKAAAASYKEPEQKPQASKGETPPTDKKVPPQPPVPPKKAATPPPPPPPPPKRPAVPPPPPTRKEEPAEPGNPKGEYKPDPKLEPKVDDKGNVAGTDIPAKNEENPNPKFVNKVSTKLDDFYKDVLDEEERAQKAVIEKMKAEGKLPADFKEVHPLPFGFKHPALKDNPELQKEFSAAVKDENKPPHWDLCRVSIPGTNKFCDENIGIPRDKMPQLGGKPKPGSEGEAKAKRIADQNVRKKMGIPTDGEIPADKKQEYDDLYAKENTQHVNVEKEFEDYLKSEGINVSDPVEVPASSLKATQSELVGEQIVGMINSLEQDPNNPFITAPIMVTRDGYVIDGHHRWATIQAYNMKHTPPNGDKEPIKMKVRIVDEDIETHIPRANAFAEKMGIETMSGKGKQKDEPKPATSTKPSTLSRIKEKLKNWHKKEKEFFNLGYHKPGSDARKTFSERLKDKASGAWKAVKHGLKNEVEEFKAAGSGVKNFFSGKPLSEHEQKALKSVAIKIAVTALTGAALGGLAHGAAGFAKHVAIEFIPHVVGETILKGAGRAAIFADANGEAEMDAQFVKFAEMIADGLENMKISPEQMEKMIDSYNKKKEEDTMKKEISIIDEIILEILNEKNPIEKADDVLNQTVKNPETNKDIKVSSALKYKNSQSKGQIQAYQAAIKLLKKAGISGDEIGGETKPKEIPGQGLGFRKTKEKELEPQTTTKKTSDSEENVEGLYDPNDKLQSSVVSAKNSNELFTALDKLGMDEQDLMLDKVQAGAGGPVASTGETLCTEAQTDLIQGRYNQKEIRNSKEYKDAVKKIDAIIFGDRIDKRAQKALAKELDKICDKMGYYDENGNPDYRLAIAMKAEADLYIQQNLGAFEKTNVARTKFKKKEDMVSWMRASFYSSYSLLNNGPADWDRKKGNGRVMKANSRTDGAVKQVLLNSLKNAKTPEEKAHYENQIKVWEKFKGYHDTYMVYKNDKGFYSVYHISNKKSDDLDDPQNNTTPETRLANYMAAAREANLSPKAAKAVNDAQLRALQGSADNDNIAKSAYGEIPEKDTNLIASLSGRLPSRSQTDVKDEYYTDLKNDKMIKDWYKKKYGDKWESKYKAAKPSEVIGVAMDIAKNTKDISKLSGNFTKFITKQGQLAQSIFDKAESGMNAKQISESFKGIYSAKEIQTILNSDTMKMLADRKAQHAAGLEGVHRGFITSLHKADGTKPGHNGKNGPAVETYVAGTLKSLHIDTYVTNYDDSVQIEMGGVGCTPIDVRGCMANLSGFKGDTTTPEGRAALNKHLAENVKVDANSDAVYLLGSDGKTRTYLASDTWRQAGSSKKIATGFGSNLRKCLTKSVSSRLSNKRNKK